MNCPCCKEETFKTLGIEGVPVARCSVCKGTWLKQSQLWSILSTREQEFTEQDTKDAIKYSFEGIPENEKKARKLCPECSTAMVPFNYASTSGIILDRCEQQHGFWFDTQELDRAQIYFEQLERLDKAPSETQKQKVQTPGLNTLFKNQPRKVTFWDSLVRVLSGRR